MVLDPMHLGITSRRLECTPKKILYFRIDKEKRKSRIEKKIIKEGIKLQVHPRDLLPSLRFSVPTVLLPIRLS